MQNPSPTITLTRDQLANALVHLHAGDLDIGPTPGALERNCDRYATVIWDWVTRSKNPPLAVRCDVTLNVAQCAILDMLNKELATS